jgi:tRNA 2-selenouridine synthase
VFVESESRKVGSLQLPDALVQRMREHARCVRVLMDDDARVQLLLQEYGFFAEAPERFCALLGALTELQGKERVERWQAMARAAQWPALFGELMREHYDPLYERSMRRNFAGLAQSRQVSLDDGAAATLRAAARELLQNA